MAWSDAVITNSGLALITRSVAGEDLTITRAGVGTETVSVATLMGQTALSGTADMPVLIAGKTVGTNKLEVLIQIHNTDVVSSLRIKQIGLFAKIGTEPEILFAIMQDSTGEEIPSEEEYPDFLLEMAAVVGMSQTDNITVEISSSAIVTKSTLDEALAKKADISGTAVLSMEQRTMIYPSSDIDNFVVAGPFYVENANVAATISHAPWDNKGFMLDVYNISATTILHIATAFDGTQKVRYKSGSGEWSDWEYINEKFFATTDQITDIKSLINQLNEDEIPNDYIESLFDGTTIGAGGTPSTSGGVSKAYVDAQDSKVLAAALARIEGTDSASQQDGNVITDSDIENIF